MREGLYLRDALERVRIRHDRMWPRALLDLRWASFLAIVVLPNALPIFVESWRRPETGPCDR